VSVDPVQRSVLGPGVLPAEIRAEGPGAQQEYRAALAFERVLLGQLAKSLQATTGADRPDGGAAAGAYASMLPDAMADALTAAGGIGLAPALHRALHAGGPRP
jgi:Rod binding domain-containing protein